MLFFGLQNMNGSFFETSKYARQDLFSGLFAWKYISFAVFMQFKL